METSLKSSRLAIILDIQNEEVLNKIDQLLNDEGYAYDVNGKSLSVSEYKQEIEAILKVSEENEVYNSEAIRNKIFKK